jgi:hypothetical protein
MSKTAVDIPLTLSYKFYKNNYENPVNKNVYIKVLKIANKKIINLLFKGIVLSLPYRLGTLYVKRYKPNYKFNSDNSLRLVSNSKEIDWKETNLLWKEHPETKRKKYLTYDNIHSDGYRMKLKWLMWNKNPGFRIYNFVPARNLVRDLAKYIKNNKIDYNDN